MTGDVLTFLGADPHRIALFETAEEAILAPGESRMTVGKSQISWGNPKKFAFLSLPRRVGGGFPAGCLILTFGLEHRVAHPRIFQSVEPYPDRWTHHVVLSATGDVDDLVRAWLAEAYTFAKTKHPRRRI